MRPSLEPFDVDKAEISLLNHKVRTDEALLQYTTLCAETRELDLQEDLRQARVRQSQLSYSNLLLHSTITSDSTKSQHLEHQLLDLNRDRIEAQREKAEALKEASKERAEAEKARREADRLKVELEALREVEGRSNSLLGEKLQLQHQVSSLKTEVESLREIEKTAQGTLQEKLELERQVKRLNIENEDLRSGVTGASELAGQVTALKKELAEVQKALTKATKEKEKAEAALEKQKDQYEAKLAKVKDDKAEDKDLKKEISDLKSSLTKETAAREKAEAALSASSSSTPTEPASASKKDLDDLRAALNKETKLREKAEATLTKQKTDYEKRISVLETKLESTKSKLTTLKSSAPNPLKRPAATLTLNDLDTPPKKPKPTVPKPGQISDFSMTPFFRRTATLDADETTTTTTTTTTTADPLDPAPVLIPTKEAPKLLLRQTHTLPPTTTSAKPRRRAPLLPELDSSASEPEPSPEVEAEAEPDLPPPKGFSTSALEALFSSSPQQKTDPRSPANRKRAMQALRKKAMLPRGVGGTLFEDEDGSGRINLDFSDVKGVRVAPGGAEGLMGGQMSPKRERPKALQGFRLGLKKAVGGRK
ncbi:hypothetical protein BJ508DRAFT_415832 [Ascobolus immersus RN42]|uniref:Uncharacterized protein n=1 Tax=Ascobolus immersus RN42 TaxID=1160509 RepID=A0A3N4I2S2_ASCIM|nr:hypothetical protein BJ508DRAFT_415832 [Ascobolus immersus RN42]